MPQSPLGPGKFVVLTLSVLVLAIPAAFTQTTTTTATSNPQAVALATQALAALTGSVQISDVTLTGTATRTAGSDVETGTITLEALGTTNSRMDLAESGGTRSEIRNSVSGAPQGWWVGLDGVSHTMANHNCLTDAVWFFPALSVLTQAASANVIASYVGQETRNGTSVQHLNFVGQTANVPASASPFLTSLTAEDLYLNSTSLLPVAVLFNTHPDSNAAGSIAVEVDFSNYQSTSGIQVPLRIQELLNNSLLLDITIQTVTVNSGLTATQFAAQ
jgi:hypothetical protein